MDSTIIIACISFLGVCLGTVSGIITSSKLINYRIEQIEKKIEKYHKLEERTYRNEDRISRLETRING